MLDALLLLPNSCSSSMREEASMSNKQVQSCGSFHTNLWPRTVGEVPKKLHATNCLGVLIVSKNNWTCAFVHDMDY